MKTSDKHQELLHACAIPVTPNGAAAVDANGIQMYEWSHPLKNRDDCCGESTECRYCCCTCFPFAQVESRMGVASFGASLRFYVVYLLVCLAISVATPWYIWHGSDGDPVVISIALVVEMVVVFALASVFVRRLAATRTKVRARFQIPGSEEDDRSLARWQSTRVLRQMVRHLQCEHVGTFARVDTLPAYEHD